VGQLTVYQLPRMAMVEAADSALDEAAQVTTCMTP
jgi:hypothetical protein